MRMQKVISSWLLVAAGISSVAVARDYTFTGSMSRVVLENYLSRSVTHLGLCAAMTGVEQPTPYFDDDLRMIGNIGAKFIGRAAYTWTPPADDDAHFALATQRCAQVHQQDPEIIIQGCVFEIVTYGVTNIPVPAWVFQEFGLPATNRNFSYTDMLYDGGHLVDHFGAGKSVPDMSKLETRMWFYYRARRYIVSGCEAMHFGQVNLMDDADPNHDYWFDMLSRVRGYAANDARRSLVLCDAHTHGHVRNGVLLFDFHSFPMRPKELVERAEEAILEVDHLDSIYGKSAGGTAPSGWQCDALPYIVELDNSNISDHPGTANVNDVYVWGYEEIGWFALQPEQYRNGWLSYGWNWVRANDSNGWMQMQTRRVYQTTEGQVMYQANRRSANCPVGYNQESTIKAVWANDGTNASVLTHLYTFDNENANDSTGVISGTVIGTPSYVDNTFIGEGKAASLNGQDQYFNFPTADFRDYFSIAAWVKLAHNPSTSHPGRQKICALMANCKAGGTRDGFQLLINNDWEEDYDGVVQFATGDGTTAASAQNTGVRIPTNEWHHVAAVVDRKARTVQIYINGSLVVTNGTTQTNFQNTATFALGANANDTANAFNGQIDDARIYNGLLTAEEIKHLPGVPEPAVTVTGTVIAVAMRRRVRRQITFFRGARIPFNP